jgi:protein-tyrosine phosphatase
MTRLLPFPTLFNFRDLGGYPTTDGRTVRWRRLYRADALSRLRAADAEAFARLGIRTVLDLRRPSEIAADGRVPSWGGLAYHNLSLNPAAWDLARYDATAGPARFLADRYLEMARRTSGELAAALAVITDAEAAPLVMHCAGGKDRTGVLASLTLALLGVPDEHIAADYALTAEAERRLAEWLRLTPRELADVPAPYRTSPPEAMRLFLAELRASHGSIEAYAACQGVDAAAIAALRAHLLV